MKAMGSILLSALSVIAVALPAAAYAQSKPILDYGFYKSRVEPIFLEKKDGHTHSPWLADCKLSMFTPNTLHRPSY